MFGIASEFLPKPYALYFIVLERQEFLNMVVFLDVAPCTWNLLQIYGYSVKNLSFFLNFNLLSENGDSRYLLNTRYLPDLIPSTPKTTGSLLLWYVS